MGGLLLRIAWPGAKGGCKAGQWPVVFGIMYMGLTLAVSKLAVHASQCLPAGSLHLPARNKKNIIAFITSRLIFESHFAAATHAMADLT